MLHTLAKIIYMVMLHQNLLRQVNFRLDSAKFNLNKYYGNSFRGCFLEVDFEYPRELQKLKLIIFQLMIN